VTRNARSTTGQLPLFCKRLLLLISTSPVSGSGAIARVHSTFPIHRIGVQKESTRASRNTVNAELRQPKQERRYGDHFFNRRQIALSMGYSALVACARARICRALASAGAGTRALVYMYGPASVTIRRALVMRRLGANRPSCAASCALEWPSAPNALLGWVASVESWVGRCLSRI
jgi:hypothetical protein